VNDENLTVIGSVATSEGRFGSSGRLQEVRINHIDHDTCNILKDGDIVDSVMICLAEVKIVADDSGGPIFGRESKRSEC
jgi:hypothetical protein